MEEENEERSKTMRRAGFMGAFWFAGWLFSIGYIHLVWWKIILGIVVWPWFMGNHLAGI